MGEEEDRLNPNFSAYTIQVRHILEGPRNLSCIIESQKFYGWAYLHLRLAAPVLDWQETRILYANPDDPFQQQCVLRSVLWNGTAARSLMRSQRQRMPIPARFVILSMKRADTYLRHFQRLTVPVLAKDSDTTGDIRGLRVARHYGSNVFEKVWHLGHVPKRLAHLNDAWEAVWSAMSDDLLKAPQIKEIVEDFWIDRFETNYDLAGYNSDQFYAEWERVNAIDSDPDDEHS